MENEPLTMDKVAHSAAILFLELYSLFTEARGVPMRQAGTWVSLYWGALTMGRIGAAMVAHYLSARRLLRHCILGQAMGALFLWGNFSALSSFLGLALTVAATVKLHDARSWHLKSSRCSVAATVKLHDARSWHLSQSYLARFSSICNCVCGS
jgi:hypothetical protein